MLLGLAECKPKIHSGNNNNNLKKVFPRTMSVGSLTMTCQNIKGYLLGKTVTTTNMRMILIFFGFEFCIHFYQTSWRLFNNLIVTTKTKRNLTKVETFFFQVTSWAPRRCPGLFHTISHAGFGLRWAPHK